MDFLEEVMEGGENPLRKDYPILEEPCVTSVVCM